MIFSGACSYGSAPTVFLSKAVEAEACKKTDLVAKGKTPDCSVGKFAMDVERRSPAQTTSR
jgi:hypothetical protein